MIIVAASSSAELQACPVQENLLPLSTGVGKVVAAATLAHQFSLQRVKAVVGVGTCRALNPNLAIGDLVVAKTVLQYDLDLRRFGLLRGETFDSQGQKLGALTTQLHTLNNIVDDSYQRLLQAAVGSADLFLVASELEKRSYLHQELALDAVDMESYSYAAVANAFQIPWAIIRCVSEDASARRPKDYQKFLRSASERMYATLEQLLGEYQLLS